MDHAIVRSYEVTIPIKARQRGQLLERRLLIQSNGIVSSCSKTMIPLLLVPLLDNQDFLFYLATQTNLTLYKYIVNHEILKVLVKNMSN